MTEKEHRRILHPDTHRMNLESYTTAFYDIVHDSWVTIMDSAEYDKDVVEHANYFLKNSLLIGHTFGLTDEEAIEACNKKWEEEQEKKKTTPPRPL